MAETIDGFQVIRKVADSQSAEIFLAKRTAGRGRGKEYALKVLRPAFADDPLYHEYLENEYRVCSAVKHPNLIRVHEVVLDSKRPHLVMDYVPGQSLRDCLARERPNISAALSWLVWVADGLNYLHDQGYVHRDVKSQNIIIAEGSPVRVIDFALARRQDTTLSQRLMSRLFERRRPGTWSYMSPEQILNEPLTGQSDVYGLGVTLYECLTGRMPFTAEDPQDLLRQHLWAAAPSPRILRPEVPIELDDFVRAMLAKDPLDRPHGMEYLSGKLRAFSAACNDID